ncbi:unnamed protein product [Caenorhabditis angaria]|uniref:Domain of unknown function DX domain-containing protein n=1 Tax=Caenorhabditis angaria TaxID=860376 RepID=A0A9P1INC8_9PELO|nr:unnamed protein product [Caenorhabditis angaria]
MKKLSLTEFSDALEDNLGKYKYCYDNEECGTGEYCDIGEEDGNTNGNKTLGLKYCFKSPGEEYLYENAAPELCKNTTECGQGYCKYFSGTYGLCVSFPICPHDLASLDEGNECKNVTLCSELGGQCEKALHDDRKACCPRLYCNDGITTLYKQPAFNDPSCDKSKSHNLNGKCCPNSGVRLGQVADTRNKCKYGVLVVPEKQCPCQVANEQEIITQWCDEKSKVCCEINKFEQYFKMYCPDARTPLYLQPTCNATNKSCENMGGICVEERCCPKLLFNEIDRKYKGLPEKTFKTEVSCSIEKPTSLRWAYTFCDVITNKLWILGKYNNFGHENVLVPTECQTIEDCDRINNRQDQYCVMDSVGKTFCVGSPYIPEPQPGQASIWHYNIAVTIVFFVGLTIIFIMMSVIMVKWICERRRRLEQFH